MRKKLLLALFAVSAAGAASLLTGAKEVEAREGYNCFVAAGHECGCPECWINNCTCGETDM